MERPGFDSGPPPPELHEEAHRGGIGPRIAGNDGQVVGLIKEIKPAAAILEDMVEEAADILTRKLPERVFAK